MLASVDSRPNLARVLAERMGTDANDQISLAASLRSRRGAPLGLAILAALGMWLISGPTVTRQDTAVVAAIASAVSLANLIVLVRAFPQRFWSVPALCGVVLFIFHIGALPELALRHRSSLEIVNRWIFDEDAKTAMWLATAGLLAFSAGALALHGKLIEPNLPAPPAAQTTRAIQADVGAVILILAILNWFRFAIASGLTPTSNYGEYLSAKSGSLQLIYILIGIGAAMSCVSHTRTLPRIAFVAFIGFAIVGLPIGLRGEVLFPLAAGSCVLARFKSFPSIRVTTISVLILFSAIAAISSFRSVGYEAARESGTIEVSPLAGMAELGATLKVVDVTVKWHESFGENFKHGKTYAVPTLDALRRFTRGTLSNASDPSSGYMNAEVAYREGNIGGSVIAEANHNWGLSGVVVIMALLGGLATFGNNVLARRDGSMAAVGVVVFAFMLHVRNAFGSVPLVILIMIFLLAGAKFLASSQSRRDTQLTSTLTADHSGMPNRPDSATRDLGSGK